MSRSRIPAIFFHSIAGNWSRMSCGIFFAASPIISMLRTKARFFTSSRTKDSSEVCAIWTAKKSASWRISRRSSSVEGCITHGRKDDTGFPLTQRAVSDEVDGSAKEPLEQFINGKEVVIGFPAFCELQIDVDITLCRGFSSGKRAKYANTLRAKGAQFSRVSFYQCQGVHMTSA